MEERKDEGVFVVEIISDLEPFIPKFLSNVGADCLLIEELLEKGDLKEIENMGHRLKGSGGSCGFSAISEAGLTIEHAAEARDRDAVALACRQLKQYLERVRVVYV